MRAKIRYPPQPLTKPEIGHRKINTCSQEMGNGEINTL
jgi:hypothetical protein